MSLGPTELVIILVIILVLFGAGRLPTVFEALGKGLKSFRDAQREDPFDNSRTRPLPDRERDIAEAEEVRAKQNAGR
jgi:sec-independent protein translocase protein TatA